MGYPIAFMVCVAGACLNLWVYFTSSDPNPISIVGAVFCGSLAVWNLVMGAKR